MSVIGNGHYGNAHYQCEIKKTKYLSFYYFIHKCIHTNIQLHMLSYIRTVSSTLSTKEIIYNNHITWCRSYKFGIRLSHIATCRSEMEICLDNCACTLNSRSNSSWEITLKRNKQQWMANPNWGYDAAIIRHLLRKWIHERCSDFHGYMTWKLQRLIGS
jgi:hypothetical protein